MSSLLSYLDKNVESRRHLINALHMITILTRANSRIRKALKQKTGARACSIQLWRVFNLIVIMMANVWLYPYNFSKWS